MFGSNGQPAGQIFQEKGNYNGGGRNTISLYPYGFNTISVLVLTTSCMAWASIGESQIKQGIGIGILLDISAL